jgi:predicted MFS family arabinose efflux permease
MADLTASSSSSSSSAATEAAAAASQATPPAWRVWLAVIFLGIGAFTIVTTELAPIGLLSQIAGEMNRSEATVGLTVTVYAWVGALNALASAFWLGRLPRKALLVTLMVGLALSNLAALLSNTFSWLLAARALGAVSHGLFWAVIGASAAQIAPKHRTGLAMSIVFGGVSAASVLGVPLATLIGQATSWRMAFGAVGAISLATALGLAGVLPAMKTEAVAGRAALFAVLRRRDLGAIYLATIFAVTAHFAAFTFIEPFLTAIPSMRATLVPALLFVFGAAGLLGNVLTGIFIDRFLASLLMLALITLSAALIALGQLGPALGTLGLAALLVVWGTAISAIFVGLQTWILRSAGAAAMPASAIYVAIFNAAIGAGALVGSSIFTRAGLPMVMTVAGAASVLAILAMQVAGRAQPASEPEQERAPSLA